MSRYQIFNLRKGTHFNFSSCCMEFKVGVGARNEFNSLKI